MEQPFSLPAVCRDVARVSLSIVLPAQALKADPFVILAELRERQAASLDRLNAALPLGSVGAQQTAAELQG